MKNADTKRKWDMLSKERRMGLIREVITYFSSEHDFEIGMIAAEDILDFFLKELTSDIYRQAIDDSKILIRQQMESLEMDMDVLVGK